MRKAIATVCLSGNLREKLEAIAAAGFKGVEIFENDLLSFNGTPKEIRSMIADLGLETITFQPFRDFEGMPAERRERVFQRAERKFDLMQELGCDLLLVCSNVSPESLGGIDRAAADFRELGERAVARGVRVGFEALAWGRHIHDYRDAWEVVRRADHPATGLVLDSFHILARKSPLDAIRAIPSDRIFLVQIADAPLLDMDYLSWSRHFRNYPGQGDLPLLDFMAALGATGFDGLLSLEVFNDQFRSGAPRRLAVDGLRSLIYLEDQLTRRDPAKHPDMPPRAACQGVAFIEFAVDETAAGAFKKLLSGLGFAKVGQHISKAVSRWRQGDINIVLNTEKEGFAHSFNITHGSAVCALCLSVDDAGATLERARILKDDPFHQAVGPGELEIPAVRGLGGSLIYFIDPKSNLKRIWEVDFKTLPANGGARDAGLVTIDHIAQSMQYQEMLTWQLFYLSLLDLKKAGEQDVLDPGGLVKSQVVESPDGALRLVLNASQSAHTQSSRFVFETFGSGVQHVAFSSRDIFATAERLKAAGVDILPIPENYYDDLEAKTDLSADMIERLKSLNILYDRDGETEYLQLYTSPFENRFFFEVVERRGYRGYGAANAPIRIAAQARFSFPAEGLL